ncbi:Acyl carrier protein [Caloramator mitchellensis]|uniref:Acyl carrier protein n=1 Tax=Caloramator mitchellensis TaxID=908809 RepID=A0A0R3JWD3_CALMK|nr:acyl carrier protein [Caloramator mitchellensis]KRQ87865.1 Acyl carrier protein [Caloramator mitchellensis]
MVLEKLTNIISENLGTSAEEIKLETSFEELGLDSLDIVELVMNIEEEFDIQIEEGENFKTVGDVVTYIESKLE